MYMVKLDLKDAFLTVPVLINHQIYLRFMWKGTMWEFVCLPFGLASALRAFTKIMKPVVGMLRKMGARLIIYLDDILIMEESKQLGTQHARLVSSTLERLGFVVNHEKSVLALALPHEKVRKIQRECQKALTVLSLTVQKVGKPNRFAKQFHSSCLSSPSLLPPLTKYEESIIIPFDQYESETTVSEV